MEYDTSISKSVFRPFLQTIVSTVKSHWKVSALAKTSSWEVFNFTILSVYVTSNGRQEADARDTGIMNQTRGTHISWNVCRVSRYPEAVMSIHEESKRALETQIYNRHLRYSPYIIDTRTPMHKIWESWIYDPSSDNDPDSGQTNPVSLHHSRLYRLRVFEEASHRIWKKKNLIQWLKDLRLTTVNAVTNDIDLSTVTLLDHTESKKSATKFHIFCHALESERMLTQHQLTGRYYPISVTTYRRSRLRNDLEATMRDYQDLIAIS